MTCFLIIAGSEKCGTTSLYSYLRSLNIFNSSIKKETDYLRNEKVDVKGYKNQFKIECEDRLLLEASPGYLTCSAKTMNNIMKLNIDVKLVFLFRNPVERFISSYQFHKSKFNIPQNVTLEEYFIECLSYYDSGEKDNTGGNWFKDVLGAGKYYERLQPFISRLSSENLLCINFDDLKNSPEKVVRATLHFVGEEYPDIDVDYSPKNVGFSAKFVILHSFSMFLNKKFEVVWLTFPKFKQCLLRIYKKINAKKTGKEPVSPELYSKIEDFYRSDQDKLNKSDLLFKFKD